MEKHPKQNNGFSHSSLAAQDQTQLAKAKQILDLLKKKYELKDDELRQLLHEEMQIPLSIFTRDLTPLHSLVKYLKENLLLSFCDIAPLLKRDQRNIWRIYHDAIKRNSVSFTISDNTRWISLSIFSSDSLSAQECLVYYLKDSLSFSLHDIAKILQRDERTIWTVYHRARKKSSLKKEGDTGIRPTPYKKTTRAEESKKRRMQDHSASQDQEKSHLKHNKHEND